MEKSRKQFKIPTRDYEIYYMLSEHLGLTVEQFLGVMVGNMLEELKQPGGLDAFFKRLDEDYEEAKKQGMTMRKWLDRKAVESYINAHKV